MTIKEKECDNKESKYEIFLLTMLTIMVFGAIAGGFVYFCVISNFINR
jgi:hypothetical protein